MNINNSNEDLPQIQNPHHEGNIGSLVGESQVSLLEDEANENRRAEEINLKDFLKKYRLPVIVIIIVLATIGIIVPIVTLSQNNALAAPVILIFKECPLMQLPSHLSSNCSKERNVGSLCSFSCPNGFHLMGAKSITCQQSMDWSAHPPNCSETCPRCFAGKYCNESISWQGIEEQISNEPYVMSSVRYDGFMIKCKSHLHNLFTFSWTCECTDIETRLTLVCHNYKSPSTSCVHSLATLIRSMVQQKKYLEPCDASLMPSGCNN